MRNKHSLQIKCSSISPVKPLLTINFFCLVVRQSKHTEVFRRYITLNAEHNTCLLNYTSREACHRQVLH